MIIDYSKVDSGSRNIVEIMENKPHIKYIRYLLTKRYSPIVIKKELQRLGLSAPHEPILIKYYFAVIDPLVKKHGLNPVYSDYRNKLLSKKNTKNTFSNYLLKYRIEFEDRVDLQIKFCKFIAELEVDLIWNTEVSKYYGKADNIPLDENGNRIIKVATHQRSLETILTSPKRYLIDKFIVENLPDKRISEYCRKNLKLSLYDTDVKLYRNVFFNIQAYDIEEKMRSLEVEKRSLETFLSTINNADMEMGEKIATKSQTEKRIDELNESIKTLNMYYSEAAFNIVKSDKEDFQKMFEEIVIKSYNRFKLLDGYKDRDIVDPLLKTAKMMGYAYEKVSEIQEKSNASSKDKHSQFELIKLYKDRADELYKQQLQAKNQLSGYSAENVINEDEKEIDVGTISGVEELGLNYKEEETSEYPRE